MIIKAQKMTRFQPGRGYSKEDWDAVSDNPPLSKEEMAGAKPFKEAFPDVAEKMERAISARGRPKLDNPKQPLNIRLDADIIQFYKATGKGWQSRMNDALRKAAGL
ncbi:BrnA antitoxin family protein [Rhizobium acaciae]|uniref:BrnA antitoxin family protein n=1 Tax=Rhizobium acaciae TaxID=2989736 RepID=UPI002220F317|nr:BrnA antitoxin family protein [Rhizobium acaciae]MCW1754540.1 BrnA antitoxin family protein [Rhizobium acaciae]